jgi:hypothetical protein
MAAALAASVVIAAVVLASPAWAATYTVTNNADSGAGSLRQAMIDANATTGVADTINFDLGSAATITLTSSLPLITDGTGLTIDGGSADITISGDNKYQVFNVDFGKLALNNLTVADGGGLRGNGISNLSGTVTLSNSTISGNSSSGIFNYNGGTLTLSNSTLSGNSDAEGGGIYSGFGTVTVSNSTLSGNSATSGAGGGIHNIGGTLTVSNSTLSGNSANDGADGAFSKGGGIYNYRGTATVSNSTISGNSAAGVGGGIYSEGDGQGTGKLEVSNSTFSGNSNNGPFSFGDGSIHNEGGTATLKNTIVANSPSASGQNCGGITITNGGYNLDSGTSCGFGTNNNSLSGVVDPMLDPLADNGGPTKTHALLEGSPAIDRGNSFGATIDQRGVARPQGTASDIGSFESAFTAIEDTIKPHVSTATPTGPGIARGTNLTATFSEKMDPLSITNSTFKLFKVKPDGSTTQITNVRVSLSTDGLVAKLNPFGTSSTVLAANTKYKGVITTGAKDVAGNQLDQNTTTAGLQQKGWTFTTKG